MKYKVGDKVLIKSIDWYNENKDMNGNVICGCEQIFNHCTARHCGQVLTIKYINSLGWYEVEEEAVFVHDGMIEGLVFEYEGLAYTLPDGYIFKDENGNVINTTKIILEKKKKEYPKTYEECAKIMNCPITGPSGWLFNFDANIKDTYYRKKDILMGKFIRLLICRDAYWKIAGEEMGLGKPWEPDWLNDDVIKYVISYRGRFTSRGGLNFRNYILAFPTEEMQDAFKENFDPDIEICKEFL